MGTHSNNSNDNSDGHGRQYNQETEFQTRIQGQELRRLEDVVAQNSGDIKELTALIQTFIAAQSETCKNATNKLNSIDKTLYGQGTAPGLLGMVSNLSLQVKLLMAFMGLFNASVLGMLVYIIRAKLVG